MQTAIIDMGTNTFHLLIVKWQSNDYQILYEERVAVRIGAGGINQNIIREDGVQRAIDALHYFKTKIIEYSTVNIRAFGTSALRNAANNKEVVDKIKNATGIETEIISGEGEARYIFEGVNLALKFKEEKSLIVDIGGGSVEFIIGNGETIFWKQSFEIGAQRLVEKFQKHDPILPNEIESLNQFFKSSLQPLFDAMKIHSPKILAGSSGTFETLSDIYCAQQNRKQTNLPEVPLTMESFEKIYQEIISKNRAERMQIAGMIELRVDIIVVTCCLIKFILDNFSFNQIRVSTFSLKEGVLTLLMKEAITR